jgi:hypothetical protein
MRKTNKTIPFPIEPGDTIVGDSTEVEFISFVEKTGLVRFYDKYGREQEDGVISFTNWLEEQEEITIERE